MIAKTPREHRSRKPWPWSLPGMGYKSACSIVMIKYAGELYFSKSSIGGDEDHHWHKHPEFERWYQRKKARDHAADKYGAARIGWRCQRCGCNADRVQYATWSPRVKFCSHHCEDQSHRRKTQARLSSDPKLRTRKRAQSRACYARTKKESPEQLKKLVTRKLSNPLYRIAKSLRNRIQDLIKTRGGTKPGKTRELLGCSWDHLKRHLEAQFTRGMTWGNYGAFWHVDHVIALARFNLKDPAQAKIACNWQNLRPLKAQKNLEKSAKLTEPQQPLPLSFA
jgi:hypothetical protein